MVRSQDHPFTLEMEASQNETNKHFVKASEDRIRQYCKNIPKKSTYT